MSGVQTVTVKEADSGQRLDRWFRQHYPQLGHGALEKLLRTGQVRVDGGRVKANRRLEAGETVRVPPLPADVPAPGARDRGAVRTPKLSPEDRAFVRGLVLYQDECVIALNKPFGLATQGGVGMTRHIDGLLSALEKDGERPRLVHRLDKDTGGLLILGRTRKATAYLARAFQTRDVEKTYWALTLGLPKPRQGAIDLRIAKKMLRIGDAGQERMVAVDDDDAKRAVTDYQVVEEARIASFLALRPRTGRTHQVRVHCAAIGSPIVGDGKYGGAAAHIDGVAGKLHLFCREMTFPHPHGKMLTLSAPLTGHMRDTWRFFGFSESAQVDWPEMR